MRIDVPKPLEAICLKAMSKEPDQRYASPTVLAEEIEKWLADEPVTAYREPFVMRARRWIKKHPAILSAATAAFLLTLAASILIASIQTSYSRQLSAKNALISDQNRTLQQSFDTIREQNEKLESSLRALEDRTKLALNAYNGMVFGVQEKLQTGPGLPHFQWSCSRRLAKAWTRF